MTSIQKYSDSHEWFKSQYADKKVLYVTPSIKEASKDNLYLKNFYLPIINNNPNLFISLITPQFARPFVKRVLKNEPSIWHQHWLQFSGLPTFVRINFRLFMTLAYKAFGGIVIWTPHNGKPHVKKYFKLNLWYMKFFTKVTFQCFF